MVLANVPVLLTDRNSQGLPLSQRGRNVTGRSPLLSIWVTIRHNCVGSGWTILTLFGQHRLF